MKPAGQAALRTSRASADKRAVLRSPAAIGAATALVAMIVLSVAWERWLAPLRPGGSALVFKALPLVFALPGVLRRRLYTLQWASMLILLYFAEGIVRGMTDAQASARLGWIETALALVFFLCALAYLAPFKRAAKEAQRGTHGAAAANAPAKRRRTPS
jgi:uncharacterized membrane protein